MKSIRQYVITLFVLVLFRFTTSLGFHKTKDAYVTLLYGDEFLLGVRVLGKSIRNTGSQKDMVVLTSDGVSDYTKTLLRADGWIIEMISLLANPNQVRPSRFWGVYTKLKIFNMTNYRKVVYLDADTVVVKNIEVLFKCGKFCANLKHSERLNSGVMVVEPSEAVFNDMMRKINTLPSYTGGDQGFLNSYFSEFPNMPLFQPLAAQYAVDSRRVPVMERLSTLYNADVGLFMLANKWMVDEKELCIIHYTLGALKPWDWWTSWLVKPVDVWQNVRGQLEESLPGTGGGMNPKDALLTKSLFLFPWCAVLFFYYHHSFLKRRASFRSLCDHIRHCCCHIRSIFVSSHTTSLFSSQHINSTLHIHHRKDADVLMDERYCNGAVSKVPACLGGVSICICCMAAAASALLALAIVPRQSTPWTGLLLTYELAFTIFFFLFGGFLRLTYFWGKTAAAPAAAAAAAAAAASLSAHDYYNSAKGRQRVVLLQSSSDAATWHYWSGMAVLSVAVPSLPCIFGITALFPRLGLMAVACLVFASFMSYAAEHLAIASFLNGFDDQETTHL